MARETIHPAIVRHISKDHITIAPGDGYAVTVFTIADAHAEAIVTSHDGLETHRLLIAAPEKGRTMSIKKHEPTGVVDIIYQDIPSAKV